MSELPTREEAKGILEARNDSLIQKYFGNPPANDKDYRTALREALRKEYPSSKSWNEAGPQDHDPKAVTDDLLTHLDYAHGRGPERSWWWARREWLKRYHRSRALRVRAELKEYMDGTDREGAALFVVGALAAFHGLTEEEVPPIARSVLARIRHKRLKESAKGTRPCRRVRIQGVC
ncbi:MAG: hypothetical protein ACE5JL_11915 [Dehalococcoidia bacterium]